MRASNLVDVDWWRLQPSVQRVAAISVSMADTRLRCGPASHPRLGSSWCMYNQSIPSRKTAVSSQIFEVPWEGMIDGILPSGRVRRKSIQSMLLVH